MLPGNKSRLRGVLLAADDGRVSGVLKKEDAHALQIVTADLKNLVIPKEQIESRKRGPSAMPEDLLKHLSRRDLRDLVEFLAELK